MSKDSTKLFIGRAGQLAVMAEFLARDLNVAIPEVDIGDDIIVIRTHDDEITRVQVKTANGKRSPQGFTAQFFIPLDQLVYGPVNLVYALVVRWRERFTEFVIIRRSLLYRLHLEQGVGTVRGDGIDLTLQFSEDAVFARPSRARERRSLTALNLHSFRMLFAPWPPVDILPPDVLAE